MCLTRFTTRSSEYTGRKRTLLLGGLPLASGWIFTICSTSVFWLYVSRFCSGIGSGMIWPALSLYLGEIADPSIRGALISLNVNVASIGAFLGNAMGPYLSMEMFAYVSLLPNILFIALFSLIPESPYHYLLRDDLDKAEASLKWFRREQNVKAEMQELRDFVGNAASTNLLDKFKELCQYSNLRKITIMICLNIFVYMTGYNVVNSYTEIIVTSSGVNLPASVVVMGLGLSSVIAGATAVFAIDRLGRRLLLMCAGFGAFISLALLGLHFHLLSIGYDPHHLTWLPILSLLAFNLFVNYGFVPMPGTLLGEIFPASLKTFLSFGFHSGNSLLAFTFTKTYQPFLDLVGQKYVFWTYALSTFLSIPYVYYFIPETKGKSLLEIQKSIGK
ncbi:facilitated trehalose transporter Tret1-2 homolog isoform X2 [Prorops nasuta]|uniref:facilitated trehalose transporter Tret1-2 homolog isoform X2 n=1 Tax=Prorops nasuta TaxID=863751 RepID=UPI0034CEA086